MRELTPKVLADWRDSRLLKVAGSTVNRDLGLLAAVITTARKEWDVNLASNPVHEIRKPKNNPARNRRFRAGEEKAILEEADSAKGKFLRDVIILAVETAMRQGEIVSLRWENVYLSEHYLYLPDSKNGCSRGVPLSNKAASILELLPDKTGQVFSGVTREAIKRAFQNACKRAKIKDFHFHDLRHEAISRFFEKGLNPIEVASISGHKTMTMLMRYTHLNASKLAERLD